MRNHIGSRLASEPARTRTVTASAAGFDAVAGFGLLTAGAYLVSPWYIASGAYYVVLGIVRAYLLGRLSGAQTASPTVGVERDAYRRGGALLALAGLAYFAASAAMAVAGTAPTYTGLLPYGVAIAAFTKAGVAGGGVAAARRGGSPVRVALRITSVCDALVSMAVTQYALMSMVGSPDAAQTSASVGMGFAAMIATCGIVMAARAPVTRQPAASREKTKETVT